MARVPMTTAPNIQYHAERRSPGGSDKNFSNRRGKMTKIVLITQLHTFVAVRVECVVVIASSFGRQLALADTHTHLLCAHDMTNCGGAGDILSVAATRAIPPMAFPCRWSPFVLSIFRAFRAIGGPAAGGSYGDR